MRKISISLCLLFCLKNIPQLDVRMNSVGVIVKKAPDVRKGVVRKVIENVRNQAATTSEPPRKILRNATCLVDERVFTVELPSNANASRMIRRIRNKIGGYSKTPKTLQELVIDGNNLVTLKSDKFVFHDNGTCSWWETYGHIHNAQQSFIFIVL